jgi:hypothetical protein
MRKALIAIVAVAMLVFAGTALAGKVGQAKLWVYDPGNTGKAVATWTKDGLSLQKNIDTSANVAAGADIKGVAGQKLTKLSFDVKDGAYCGAGAPRFNVDDSDGATSFFGCTQGEHTSTADGWTRVTFTGGSQTIKGVDVVMDEQGKTLLRNITVNGVAVDKF